MPRGCGRSARATRTSDVLACAGCGGRLRFLATIEDPPIVAKILAHLGLPTELPAFIPARSPPPPDEFDFT